MLPIVMGNIDFSLSRDGALGRLTEKQCECLELVLRHFTSKQIAKRLGISPHTVNQRLDLARKALGASTRLDAAVRYAKLKGIPDSFVYHYDIKPNNYENSKLCGDEGSHHAVYEPTLLVEDVPKTLGVSPPEDSGLLILEDSLQRARAAPWDRDAILRPFAGPLAETNETVRRLVMILGLSILMMMVIIVGIAVAESLNGVLVRS